MFSALAITLAPTLAVLPGSLLWVAIVFFILAIIAYIFGATGIAGMSASIGRTLLFVFLVLAILFVVVGAVT